MPVNLFEAMKGLQTAIVGFMLAVFLAAVWAFNSSIQVVEQAKKPSSPPPLEEEETPFRNDPVLSKLWERTVKRLRSRCSLQGSFHYLRDYRVSPSTKTHFSLEDLPVVEVEVTGENGTTLPTHD